MTIRKAVAAALVAALTLITACAEASASRYKVVFRPSQIVPDVESR